MRLFVGVEIDRAVVERLESCIAALRRRASALAPGARIGWVTADRLHLTVRFIGEVDDAAGREIGRALAPRLALAPFAMHVRGVETFPERGAPRVVWAGVHAGGDALLELEREVSGRLQACGVPQEERPYHPHVTLARIREASSLRSAALVEAVAGREFGTSAVEAITLFQSRTSPQGASYTALARVPLAP